MKNIVIGVLGLVVIIISGMFLYGCSFATGCAATSISASLETVPQDIFSKSWLSAKNNGAKLIDLRTKQEYNAGHYQGAKMIDFYSPNFKQELLKLNKNTAYYIYCGSGNRSGQVLKLMREMGFKKVYNLDGGINSAQNILTII